MATLTKVHFAAGALECYPALAKGQKVTPDMDVDAFFAGAIREQDDVTLSSSHPHGGNAINEDSRHGIVDLDCRVHETTNVLVTDTSVRSKDRRLGKELVRPCRSQLSPYV